MNIPLKNRSPIPAPSHLSTLRGYVVSSLAVIFSVLSLVAPSASANEPAIESPADIPAPVDFNEHIRPIFNAHCTACHGGVKQAADVSFAYRDQVLPPQGWIVEPGDPDASIIIQRVLSDDPDERMPPPEHGPALSSQDINLLGQWIRQGADWTEHWAYQTPHDPPVPIVKSTKWPLQPLDNFVLQRLEAEGIEPSADATPERWLRRVTLDLTGLPPTIEQRQKFLSDLESRGELAFIEMVDRLLDSPGFGERWASVWLDLVRYADSKGLGLDGRRNIWKYRDWVINSLNQDLPYDQFTIKQIAGDLLPEPTITDRVATAGHRLTQSNEEGGTDDEEFRVAAVLDRVNTTWQTWQGVTFGCVQCHSHPYDPFQHDEYYQFAAFFNNTADCDLDEEWPTAEVPLDPAKYNIASELDRQIVPLRELIWRQEFSLLNDSSAWQPIEELVAAPSNSTKLAVERHDDHAEFHTVGTVSSNLDITLEATLPENLRELTAIRLTALPLDPETAVADSEWGFVLSHVKAELVLPDEEQVRPLDIQRLIIDEPEPFYDPNESLNEKSNHGYAAYSRISHSRQVALLLKDPVAIPVGAKLKLTLQHRKFILAAFSLIIRRGHVAVSDDPRFVQLLQDSELIAKRQQLADLEKQRKGIKSTSIPVLQELPDHLSRPTHVFIRGLFLTKDKLVTPGTPKSLPPLAEGMPANRLSLAEWLVSPENPLTARVAVNRIWGRLFGSGLVATEEDFGSSGEPPSHPQLLDFLAYRYQHDLGWSTKELIRELVLSRTYRQTAKVRPDLLVRDPQNRLLARGPRHRLPAEIVRDQSLALAGLLSDELLGPPVHPPLPDGVWNPFQAGDKWDTPDQDQADRYRRSIYTYTKRSIPYPMFAAFDAPSREFCTPRRLRSNTPLQALMTLNDETFRACAIGLAERMRQASSDQRDQIAFGFRLATCREPDSVELAELIALSSQFANDAVTQDTALQGLTIVAGVLLNLDEVLSK